MQHDVTDVDGGERLQVGEGDRAVQNDGAVGVVASDLSKKRSGERELLVHLGGETVTHQTGEIDVGRGSGHATVQGTRECLVVGRP